MTRKPRKRKGLKSRLRFLQKKSKTRYTGQFLKKKMMIKSQVQTNPLWSLQLPPRRTVQPIVVMTPRWGQKLLERFRVTFTANGKCEYLNHVSFVYNNCFGLLLVLQLDWKTVRIFAHSSTRGHSRAVKQKVWNEAENRERDYGRVRLARSVRVRPSRLALPISSLILRKNRLFRSLVAVYCIYFQGLRFEKLGSPISNLTGLMLPA